MFSIVIVYNDSNIHDSLTLRSLRRQTAKHELILQENIGNHNFTSAATALNAGAARATGEFLMFMHQDVDLLDDRFLETAEEMLVAAVNLGIAGVAGMSESGSNHRERQRNRIYQGTPRRPWGEEIHKPERVQTLDECLLIVPREIFKTSQFDEKTCDNWHLYGADYCLTIAAKGKAAYVLPLPIYHLSSGDSAKVKSKLFSGSLSPDYFRTFEAVRRKHKQYVSHIHTTCASYATRYPIFTQRAIGMSKRLLGFCF